MKGPQNSATGRHIDIRIRARRPVSRYIRGRGCWFGNAWPRSPRTRRRQPGRATLKGMPCSAVSHLISVRLDILKPDPENVPRNQSIAGWRPTKRRTENRIHGSHCANLSSNMNPVPVLGSSWPRMRCGHRNAPAIFMGNRAVEVIERAIMPDDGRLVREGFVDGAGRANVDEDF